VTMNGVRTHYFSGDKHCADSCKSNYHMITTTTVPQNWENHATIIVGRIRRSRRGGHRKVVKFTIIYAISAITTKVVSSSPAQGEVHSIQHYVI
jgi:hypothetical protein